MGRDGGRQAAPLRAARAVARQLRAVATATLDWVVRPADAQPAQTGVAPGLRDAGALVAGAVAVVVLAALVLWFLFDSGLTAPAGFVYSTF